MSHTPPLNRMQIENSGHVTTSGNSGSMLSAMPRSVLEHLPLPCVVLEPSLRCHFANLRARQFFGLKSQGLDHHMIGADELFPNGIRMQHGTTLDPSGSHAETSASTTTHKLLCKRLVGSVVERVWATCSISSFVPGHAADYFSHPLSQSALQAGRQTPPSLLSPSSLSNLQWHCIIIQSFSTLATGLSPAATSDTVADPVNNLWQPEPNPVAPSLDFPEFAKSALSRSTLALSPDFPALPMRTSPQQVVTESFFPPVEEIPASSNPPRTAPSSSSHLRSTRSPSGRSQSSGYMSASSQEPPSIFSATSTTSAISDTQSMSSVSASSVEEVQSKPSSLAPLKDPSPAQRIIAQHRAKTNLSSSASALDPAASSGPRQEPSDLPPPPALSNGAEAHPESSLHVAVNPVNTVFSRCPLTLDARSSSSGTQTSASSSKTGSVSSNPTARPLGTPLSKSASLLSEPGSDHGQLDASHPVLLLAIASLNNMPKTGLIIVSKDFTGGYVNGTARELLMGIPARREASNLGSTSAAADESSATDDIPESLGLDAAWIGDGVWFSQGPSASGRNDDCDCDLLRSVLDESNHHYGSDQDTSSAPHSHSFKRPANSQRTSATNVHLKPSQRTVGSMDDSESPEGPSNTTPLRPKLSVVSILERSLQTMQARRGKSPFAESRSSPTRKPYKVFDASFSQRIIDPLEPLLQRVVQRGEGAESVSSDLVDSGGLVVGIEVEVSDDCAEDFPTFVRVTDVPPSGVSSAQSHALQRRRIRRRIVEIVGAPIHDSDGQHIGGLLQLRDVTDQRSAATNGSTTNRLRESTGRKSLRGNASYFKQILDNMPQMVWTTTPTGSYDYFNNQWYEYTGLEPEQSMGIGWQNPFHEADMPHTIRAWAHSLATGEPYSVEYRCRRHDGSYRWMLGRALPMRDSDGVITGWFGTCTDVEEFICARQQLATTQEQIEAVINSANVTLASFDRDQKLVLLRGSLRTQWEEIYGRPPEGLHFSEIAGQDYYQKHDVAQKFEDILSGKQSVIRFETSWHGTPMQTSFSPLTEKLYDDTTRIIGVTVASVNITGLRLAQEALQSVMEDHSKLVISEAAAKEASRLKTEFVSTINHELRTPVAGMIGLAELLLEEPDLPKELRGNVEKIVRSGEILLDMVGEILDMNKIEAGKLETEKRPFLLYNVVQDARLHSFTATRKGLEFIDREQGKRVEQPVIGDMPRVRQILSNLLSNAVKFTTRGSITLTVIYENETDTSVTVKFIVQDTGIGIKEGNLSHLFRPFEQEDVSTSRRFGGSGLGLFISQKLAELMGGQVELESTFGQGTRASLTLPFSKAPPSTTPLTTRITTVSSGEASFDRSKTWILVAEDNQINREIVVRHLQNMHFNVKAVSDGEQVLRALDERHWDLILMDGQMPIMDGYKATQSIRLRQEPHIRDIKVIALTASAIEGDRQRCIEAGMDDYLAKPVRAKSLEQMLLKHLNVASRAAPSELATAFP